MRPAFGPSCTESVYPGCWHFDNDSTSKFDDVLIEHGTRLLLFAVQVQKKIWTGLGLGIGGLRTRVLGQGLTIKSKMYFH